MIHRHDWVLVGHLLEDAGERPLVFRACTRCDRVLVTTYTR